MTDAERIAALEDELTGARFAAESHLNTVKSQNAIIAGMQAVQGAVVASDGMLRWALRELLTSLPERRDWFNPDAEAVFRAALASAPVAPQHPIATFEGFVDGEPRFKLNGTLRVGTELYAGAATAQPTQQTDAPTFERMFMAACEDLGAINEALGLDPDDGGAEPIIAAIEALRAERDQWVDAGYAAAQPVAAIPEAPNDTMPKRTAFVKWCEGRGLDTSVEKDAWGAHIFKHTHIQTMWEGWFNAPTTLPAIPEAGQSVLTDAARAVLAERERQITVEKRTPDGDDEYIACELALAASAYAVTNAPGMRPEWIPGNWPWNPKWWKPTTPRRNLVKAGALILAEIERLDRMSSASAAEGEQP